MTCAFIPPWLVDRIAAAEDEDLARSGHRTRDIDDTVRQARQAAVPQQKLGATTKAPWEVHTADDGSVLPGELVRAAGEPAVGDPAVNEVADGVEGALALFRDLGRSSYDDQGAPVLATVHYEQGYDNAFWNGTQLVFGDGDGKVFGRFTRPIDVGAHEFTHAVTQYTANLTYSGQSGALNESMSDCFGICVKQRALGQDAASADWLIGEGIFEPGVQGKALRSMKEPGTAYDDPRLGKDPQVGSMDDYVDTTEDDGGVHINSGIPNRAFYLAATGIGGDAWSGAGRIWYAALTSGLAADTDFAGFAAACVAAAGDHTDVVRSAWEQVGVTASTASGSGAASTAPDGQTLEVTRSGGFAGIPVSGSLDLAAGDDRAVEARALLAQVDLDAVAEGMPQPDRFVYCFSVHGRQTRVHEEALTPELRRLVELALE
ncbi:MAG TPA: protealysin inhibitor emfourin [Marmoricola sp.]